MKRLACLALVALSVGMSLSASAEQTKVNPALVWTTMGGAVAAGVVQAAAPVGVVASVAKGVAQAAGEAVSSAGNDTVDQGTHMCPIARPMEVQVYDGAGARPHHLLTVADVNFTNQDTAPRLLPRTAAQWQAYWDEGAAEYRAGRDPEVLRKGETAGLRARWFVKDCSGASKGEALHGAVSQAGINAQGQRWVKVSVRAILDMPAKTQGACEVQAPVYRNLYFEGVLDSNPEQNFIVQQDGETYTFRFVARD